MLNTFTIKGTDKVYYHTDDNINQAVVDEIILFCIKYNCCAGEVLMQDDNCQIYAPSLISNIIDNILEFKTQAQMDGEAASQYMRCTNCDTPTYIINLDLEEERVVRTDVGDRKLFWFTCPSCKERTLGYIFEDNK